MLYYRQEVILLAIRSEAQKKAVAKYNTANYTQIAFRVFKGEKDAIVLHAADRGESLNAFINRAIFEQMKRDREQEGIPTDD